VGAVALPGLLLGGVVVAGVDAEPEPDQVGSQLDAEAGTCVVAPRVDAAGAGPGVDGEADVQLGRLVEMDVAPGQGDAPAVGQ
jgi:hypothetical protein